MMMLWQCQERVVPHPLAFLIGASTLKQEEQCQALNQEIFHLLSRPIFH